MSDDDLIRRSDSIRIVETFGHDKQMVLDTLRAIPATDAREAALREAAEALRDWQDDLNANRMSETAVTVGMAADVVIDMIGEDRT